MALKIKPRHKSKPSASASSPQVQAKLNEAIALHQQGRFEQAITLYSDILKVEPRHFDAIHLLGVIADHMKNHQLAVDLIDQAIAINSSNAPAYFNRGNALKELRRFNEAIASYDRAVALRPRYAEAYLNRGLALHQVNQPDMAIESFDKAIKLNPDLSIAHFNRGSVLQDLDRLESAVASFEAAIRIDPHYAEAYNNRGNALKSLRRLEDAVDSLNNAISIRPDFADAYSNLGSALHDLGRFGPAIASYDKAISIEPTHAGAHFNKSLALLLNGDYANGWDLYEWRTRYEKSNIKPISTTKPPWAGSDNKRVLVWAEQGIGDEVMFSSLLSEIQPLCSRLIVKVDPRLIPLFERSMSKEISFVSNSAPLDEGEYDEHISMGSLCRYFRQSEARFSSQRQGYIVDNEERTSLIRSMPQFGMLSRRKRIGISWRSKNVQDGPARSLALRDLVYSLSSDGVDLVNLQYGDTDSEIEKVRLELGVDVVSCKDVDNFNDIDGLVSLIQACDLVVSVDNSTVHLAGALGKDTRVLLPYVPDWRWLLDRDDSPWYASVRLYRRGRDMDWGGVLSRVKSDLAASDF